MAMDLTSFENFIMDCCKRTEFDLRSELKELLVAAGFTWKEDDYLSRRAARNPDYASVHNLLFTRGKPSVVLVAHTDVCRDHWSAGQGLIPPRVQPVIKEVKMLDNSIVRVIQDKDCDVQVGGDDRLGVAINVWIALNTGYDLALLFTTDEEIGLISAGYASFEEFNDYRFFCQVDRGNQSYQLVSSIGGFQLMDPRMTQALLSIASSIGFPRREVDGLSTDVALIKENFPKIQACNMTCGYHNSHSNNPREWIHIEQARETMKFVSAIVKEFDISTDLQALSDQILLDSQKEESYIDIFDNEELERWRYEDLLMEEEDEENPVRLSNRQSYEEAMVRFEASLVDQEDEAGE